jgi:hypothetical protein
VELALIRSVLIRNFQAHKRIKLDFDPGVNSIVGPSDVGKSAVLRAIRWVVFNRPLGEAFIRDGATSCLVRIETDEGRVVRNRDDGTNGYRLGKQVLLASRGEVPDVVSSVLRLSDVNFQWQHDGPFWFCNTAGDVSRQLNTIVDLSLMDDVLSRLATRARKARAEVSVVEDRVKDARQRRAALSCVPVMSEHLDEVEQAYKECIKTSECKSKLAVALTEVSDHSKRAERLASVAHGGENVVVAGELWAGKAAKRGRLEGLLSEAVVKKREASIKVPETSELDGLGTVAAAAEKAVSDLAGAVLTAQRLLVDWELAKEKEKASKAEFLNRMGTVCPLCGNKIDP